MSYDDPADRLQYLARAEEARTKAEETEDSTVRAWWENAADAWQYLADTNRRSFL
jgi:hypothetical protein